MPSEGTRAHRMARMLLADIQAMTRHVGPEGRAWAKVRARRPVTAATVDRVTSRLVQMVRDVAWSGADDVEALGERELDFVAQLLDRIEEAARVAGVPLNVDRWVHNATESA